MREFRPGGRAAEGRGQRAEGGRLYQIVVVIACCFFEDEDENENEDETGS